MEEQGLTPGSGAKAEMDAAAERLKRIHATGRKTTATVVGQRETGRRLGAAPVVEITFDVEDGGTVRRVAYEHLFGPRAAKHYKPAARSPPGSTRATLTRSAPAVDARLASSAVEISTDRDRIDRPLVHAFLSEHSYWARWRTREQNDRIIDASLCFGAYDEDGRQVGHARVIGDGVAFGYLGDVFVVPEARGRGVGKALMEAVLAHPDVRDLKRFTLVTDDAHGLYERYGFVLLEDVRKWMQRRR